MNSDFTETHIAELHLYDGLQDEPCTGENFLIPGPVGVLEALISCPEQHRSGDPIAVICHPHPLYGGSMANKVVHSLANTFNDLGVATLRFNFRGVGHSEGVFNRGVGEREDLLAAIDWMRLRHPDSPLWLAGFSFGAFVAFTAHEQAGADRLLLVAPPVAMFDFGDIDQVQIPWMVIQGGKDDVSSPEKVSSWVSRQRKKPIYHWMGDADHFFHGRLNRIKEAVADTWQT
jgi:hypothetical protein